MRTAGGIWLGSRGVGGASRCPFTFVPVLKPADSLVALGFRCWVLGYLTEDIDHWHEAVGHYTERLGNGATAQHVVMELSEFVMSVSVAARRDIEVFPRGCTSYCLDECLAVALVAGCQHKVGEAVSVAASRLTREGLTEAVIASAEVFALTLGALGQRVSTDMLALTRGNHN